MDAATLRYHAWHDIEEDWDFAYVEVSEDGGETWTILETTLTTDANPNGTAFGPGITGESNGWVEDSVDLAPYAGKEVLVRFEYVTDDAENGRGLCLDDFSIEELGWSDDAETDGGWEANGFARVNNLMPEEFLVQVVRKTPGRFGGGDAAVAGRSGRRGGTAVGGERGAGRSGGGDRKRGYAGGGE